MANKVNQKRLARQKRHRHILKKIRGTAEKPRLLVFRSSRHIYAQVIDDSKQKTLFSISTMSKDLEADLKKANSKVEKAAIVGKKVAEIAREKGITRVVFDRGGYLYHGRVKALADGAREGGLQF